MRNASQPQPIDKGRASSFGNTAFVDGLKWPKPLF